MTEINHLKCLSAVKSMAGVIPLTPAAFPGTHCPMHTALSLGSRIKGLSTLVIGTPECAYYSRNVPRTSPYYDQGLHWTYLLDGKEVVFGFRDGLIRAVREMDASGAKVILLPVTCVPEVIGEDVGAICAEIQPDISAKLIYVPLGNFKCGSYQPGYWKTLEAMGALIEKTDVKSETVNILGRSAIEDHVRVPQVVNLLQKHGVPLRFLAPDSSYEDFVSAGDARLNVSLSPFMNPFGERVTRESGTPMVSLHDLYSPERIAFAYDEIGKYTGLDIAAETAKENAAAIAAHEKAIATLTGLNYISANIGALQTLPLTAYLAALGMYPIMIHLEDFYPSDAAWKDEVIHGEVNPVICIMLNEPADRPVIETLCPDLVLGDWGGRMLPKPPSVQIIDLYGHVGYERTTALLSRLTTAVAMGNGDFHGTL